MISKNKIKLIRSLEQKKFRKEQQLFVAEGHKLVDDLLPAFDCTFLAALKEWLDTRREVVETLARKGCEIQEVSAEELQKASLQKNPQDVLAVFHQRQAEGAPEHILKEQLCLGLDGVQDPGNLGTIIRIADWFGIEHIFCSPDTADLYNPKTVQATMGAMARVCVHYLSLTDLLRAADTDTPVYGTFLDGNDMYGTELSSNGLIVMGNEGKGISRDIASLINRNSHRLRRVQKTGYHRKTGVRISASTGNPSALQSRKACGLTSGFVSRNNASILSPGCGTASGGNNKPTPPFHITAGISSVKI